MTDNSAALERCVDDIERQLGEFLRNGLARKFLDLDGLLKSEEFDISTQLEPIRQNFLNCYAMRTIQTGEHSVLQSKVENADESQKKRKLENGDASSSSRNALNIPSNGLIAQREKLAVPRITEFNEHINMLEMAGNVLMTTPIQVGYPNEKSYVEILDDNYFKGRFSPLINSMKEMKETSVNFHERMSSYHERRAHLIHELILNDRVAEADGLLAVAELDVATFLAIRETLCRIRNLYLLGLAFDNILSRNAESNDSEASEE